MGTANINDLNQSLTPEQRSAAARHAVTVRWRDPAKREGWSKTMSAVMTESWKRRKALKEESVMQT